MNTNAEPHKHTQHAFS